MSDLTDRPECTCTSATDAEDGVPQIDPACPYHGRNRPDNEETVVNPTQPSVDPAHEGDAPDLVEERNPDAEVTAGTSGPEADPVGDGDYSSDDVDTPVSAAEERQDEQDEERG